MVFFKYTLNEKCVTQKLLDVFYFYRSFRIFIQSQTKNNNNVNVV